MRYMTAGESHGPQLTGIIEGFPAGLSIDIDLINQRLAQRQGGYGRGQRMQIETDQVEIMGGVRHLVTLGAPICLVIQNRDHANWGAIMAPTEPGDAVQDRKRAVTTPRPGHADLVGGLKYQQTDLRNVLERSSARETAMRVAIGALCEQLLAQLDISVLGYVTGIGSFTTQPAQSLALDLVELRAKIEHNDLRLLNDSDCQSTIAVIEAAKAARHTLGGTVQVLATGLPAGLGDYTTAGSKLDGRLAQSISSINAIKGVSFGDGFALGQLAGNQAQDPIEWTAATGYTRTSNHLGGLEGGMTNGLPLVINAVMKPIPTQMKPLATVEINQHQKAAASTERSDVVAVTAASVVAEAMTAITLCEVILEAFGGQTVSRIQSRMKAYRQELLER
ncbi:chorismate synthase [Latilactobacillus fuchuensis]|uniref:Chorismate synthase n=1 Tax=Latilactobacillus fuchuensis TaxID=164393 RepID=A0A2N9DVY5_9LACO|nr:chorismate synthase [Latilactobacillus fuchuensis]MCP8857180.1 chorismate synthase [Latilactobacillus fuchuensis]SPC38720.1 chorismate synthase [Latilactobacillus fuchuensis]